MYYFVIRTKFEEKLLSLTDLLVVVIEPLARLSTVVVGLPTRSPVVVVGSLMVM